MGVQDTPIGGTLHDSEALRGASSAGTYCSGFSGAVDAPKTLILPQGQPRVSTDAAAV